MLAFKTDAAAHGAKKARMDQRTTSAAKALIDHAAEMQGISEAEFVIAAATKAARDTLREYETTVLTEEDRVAFLRAWDATEPTSALVDLMKS
jgi:uncharacterized protein (DUF1778 family)